MSYTPRTEAEVNRTDSCPMAGVVTVDANFACQLERELNEANARIKTLIAERDTARSSADTKWDLRDEFKLVLGTEDIAEGVEVVKGLKERIRRLEEAAEIILDSCPTTWQRDVWYKAKEAKP